MTGAAIQTIEDLRRHYEQPGDGAVRKSIPKLDDHCRRFIAASPFLVIATFDGNGNADASPRGDQVGFVEVIDDRHIVLPDRPGNNRLDTLENIIANPAVGLLFFIPGIRETLRLNGTAVITADPDLLKKHAVDGKSPKTALKIEVREAYLHCAKALIRSHLWQQDTWPEKSVIASPGRIWADHTAMGINADDIDHTLEEKMRDTLY